MLNRLINRRRIMRGGGPVRYTGWSVPSYTQSQQQYGYTDQPGYPMNPPQGPYQPYPSAQGYGNPQPQNGQTAPGYYDASRNGAFLCFVRLIYFSWRI